MMTSHAIGSSTCVRRLVQPAVLTALGLASSVALAGVPICEPEAFVNTLYTFGGVKGGASQPEAAPLQASDGNLYGTTGGGGSMGQGTVYKLTTSGVLTILHSFQWTDGSAPITRLIEGSDGALYGTTLIGGAASPKGLGVVFKITLDGTFTVLHALATDGSESCDPSALIQASDGNFYGTTAAQDCMSKAGTDKGTVFKMTPDGVFTTLHHFDGSDGADPVTGLVEAADGYLYGQAGGKLFRVSLSGTFTELAKTGGGSLIVGPKGTFYGLGGGVIQITPTTVYVLEGLKVVAETTYPVTTLHSFPIVYETGSLILASDGALYGTTHYNGPGGYGTLYRVDPGGGGYSLLFTFDSSDGVDAWAMAQGSDGTFYGAALGTGPGTIFTMNIACVPPLHTAAARP
jgi:uncharacterized repeat protein (TIGR03803 family)